MGCKKKLYRFRPPDQKQQIETHYTRQQRRTVVVQAISVERGVRDLLAEKISGTHVGLWLLVPEHLRLGTWDVLRAWSGASSAGAIEPRLALQMVHESALCANRLADQRALRQKGFEVLNGLPFVATDQAIHQLLDRHTVAEAEALQLGLGKMRQGQGHYPGRMVLIDPHRISTWSQRQMQPKKAKSSAVAKKTVQTFFAIDGDSGQPFGFAMGSSSVTVSQATAPLLERLAQMVPSKALCIADTEHCTEEILKYALHLERFSILVPMWRHQGILREVSTMTYTPMWAGYSVAEGTHRLSGEEQPFRLLVQRTGETPQTYDYKPFLTTNHLPAADLMTLLFPERWNIEEFFNLEDALGWNRASTLNLNIRFGRLSMALIAQAAIYGVRQKLPTGMQNWTAENMAQKLFNGIDGDIRVTDDTILVTLYNAPDAQTLKDKYEHLPNQLEAQGIDPHVPWLYNFKVDFRFK